ncbi:MAG: HTTM domain-containing protein [Myxococcota bacterium]
MLSLLRRSLALEIDGASLAVFRVLFGLVMLYSTIRFVANGWVQEIYVDPSFHFTYFGFSWVRVLPETGMYVLFLVVGLASIGIALGAFYRFCVLVFLLGFTYLELCDKTTYLNHYYLMSLVAFLMLFMPLHRTWSVDSWRRGNETGTVPRWTLLTLRLQLGLVYFYAGLAKLNHDWLIRGEPLATWLQTHTDLPLVGPLMDELWVALLASWTGAIFDLLVFPALLWPKTRRYAYAVVVVFHLMTALLFPIGVFPWVMMALTTAFFAPDWPRQAWARIRRATQSTTSESPKEASGPRDSRLLPSWAILLLAGWFLIQFAVPLRFLVYPGNTHWTEEGYRFSWKVMLIEKTGQVDFLVRGKETGREWTIHPREDLTPLQIRMMTTQPDMILEYAHRLRERFRQEAGEDVEVRADAVVAFNGRRSQPLIDPRVDLGRQRESFTPKPWIVPLNSSGALR